MRLDESNSIPLNYLGPFFSYIIGLLKKNVDFRNEIIHFTSLSHFFNLFYYCLDFFFCTINLSTIYFVFLVLIDKVLLCNNNSSLPTLVNLHYLGLV